MKPFLILFAAVMISVPAVLFGTDFGNAALEAAIAKRDVNEAAAAASLLIDEDAYGDGFLLFKDWEILEMLEDAVGDKYIYTVYVADQKKQLREYTNDTKTTLPKLSRSEPMVFDGEGEYYFVDKQGKRVVASDPSVVVILQRPGDNFRNVDLQEEVIIRSAMYVMDGRGGMI